MPRTVPISRPWTRLVCPLGWILVCCFCSTLPSELQAQDSTVRIANQVVTLKEVVIRSKLNVAAFIDRIRKDSSFYKAFKNLKILGYTGLNDIRMMDKRGKLKASLYSRTRQQVAKGCRWMKVLEQQVTGDLFNRNGNWNYYTAQLYASLFFATDTICGDNNIVGDSGFDLASKSGMEKRKEQLKMLIFDPGARIPGIPFIGDKIALFDEGVSDRYDFIIDMAPFRGEMCYVFRIIPRGDLSASEKNQIVFNEMTTWFRISDWDIVARTYDLSYNTGIYDFAVTMQVEMTRFKEFQVPSLIRYNGEWGLLFRKKERGVFTATLFDFTQ
jgi:hypothetical protein